MFEHNILGDGKFVVGWKCKIETKTTSDFINMIGL